MSDNPDVAEPAHRLPTKGPHAGAAEDLRLWGELGRLSNATVADSAGKWRAGTAGLFTALTGLLFISGQDAGSLAEPWRFWVIGCVVAAAVAVMISLWCALAAEAPPLATLDYQKIIGEHGSVPGYQASVAETGARLLSYSRWATVAGLILFLLGSALRKMSTFLGQLLMVFVEFGSCGGLLIQAAVGRGSGTGWWRTNRSGCCV